MIISCWEGKENLTRRKLDWEVGDSIMGRRTATAKALRSAGSKIMKRKLPDYQ